ncbi:RAD55 family ATPase [Halopenitus persicus]|uniref:RAD55 family ATPase n=1 Tax=Halopenitus persicus TaxID=1048396 RepID=UPI001E610FE3|nr:transcriptional regulator [Halopenitus persicus]
MTEAHHMFEDEESETEESTVETLSTGIDILDRKLDGGIPAGRTIALLASPACQSELFLYEMAAARETVYLTTERTTAEVELELERAGTSPDAVDVRRLDDDPVGSARSALEGLTDESMLIVDPINALETADDDVYRAFLNDLKTRTVETGGIALLHCLDGRDVPAQRDRTEYHADVIFDLVTKLRGGSVENRLSLPKFRGGESLPNTIELDLTSDVTIDVSRKIA